MTWRRVIGWTWTVEGWLRPGAWLADIRASIQRGQRGWADRDTWGLDTYLARVVVESVEYLRTHHCGHPVGMTEAEWDRRLRRLAFVYRQYVKTDEESGITREEVRRLRGEMARLIKHFPSLWD